MENIPSVPEQVMSYQKKGNEATPGMSPKSNALFAHRVLMVGGMALLGAGHQI
ncbi:MAG: hypothetical protein JW896_13330 [Deltaproteobacteria bacterium]|nr:hypothetical protein [Deltaproteobacteria bacterium]